MNPMSILKGAKVFLILGVISYGLITVNSFMKDQRALRDSVITVNAEKVSAQAQAQELANANVLLEAKAEIEARFRADTQRELEELNETFTQIRLEQSTQTQILEGTRLQNAMDKRHTLVVRLANRATRKRFDEVEGIFND